MRDFFTLHLSGHYIFIFLTMNLWITWGQNHRMGIIISKYLTQLCPGVEQSVDTKRGLWMLNHTHAHVQIWILLHPLSLNLIFKSKSKTNLSQSCSCLCPEDKSFPVIYAMAEKLTWDDFLMKITFCIFYTKMFVTISHTYFCNKNIVFLSAKIEVMVLACQPPQFCHLHFCLQAGSWAAGVNPRVGGEIR